MPIPSGWLAPECATVTFSATLENVQKRHPEHSSYHPISTRFPSSYNHLIRSGTVNLEISVQVLFSRIGGGTVAG